MATIYYTAATLDGFLADDEHSLEWLFQVTHGPEVDALIAEFMARVGALAMGASTYEWVLKHEKPHERPGSWQQWYADRPAWVFTHRKLTVIPDADVRFVYGEVEAVHREMTEAAHGKDVWLMGGGDLVGQFADAHLVDELVVTIAPVTLGSGAPLLPRRLLSDRLELTAMRRAGQFAMLTYALDG